MITVILFSIAGILLLVRGAWDWMVLVFHTIFGFLIGLLIGTLVALVLPQTTQINTYEHQLVSFQDNSSMSGDFFLGSGEIKGEWQYVYYHKDRQGYKMNMIPYDKSIINYDDSPRVVITKREPVEDWTYLWAIDIPETIKYNVYVPEGTIKSNYNLDLK